MVDVTKIAREAARRYDIVEVAHRLLGDPPAERAIAQARALVADVNKDVLEAATKATAGFFEAFSDAMPENWRALTSPQVFDVVDLMEGTGWSLVWTPPTATVLAILETRDPERRRELLLAAEPEVLADLEELLARVTIESLAGLRESAREALEAYRSGYFKSSQALTTATLSSVLHEHLRYKSHRKVRKKFLEAAEDEAPIRDFRWVAVQRALAKALESDYNPVTSIPERSDFNRNASAHRVKAPQYRPVNALSGLMLLVSVLVELDDLAKLDREPIATR